MKPKKWITNLCLVALCGCAGAAGSALYMNETDSNSITINTSSSPATATSADTKETNSINIAKQISKSVVAITTENIERNQLWFGNQVTAGAGSGVVIDEDGYIVTCAHVVNGASRIGVTTSDNKKYTAQLVGMDVKKDIAVVKIKARNLTPATFADSSKIEQGQKVYAIGNPEGTFANSITSGIISATNRKITVQVDDNSSSSDYENIFGYQSQKETATMNVIQTDASVSPGNSGGGLFDENAHLIGIVNSKATGENTEGIAFSIKSNDAVSTIKKIIKNKNKSNSSKENNGIGNQNEIQMP